MAEFEVERLSGTQTFCHRAAKKCLHTFLPSHSWLCPCLASTSRISSEEREEKEKKVKCRKGNAKQPEKHCKASQRIEAQFAALLLIVYRLAAQTYHFCSFYFLLTDFFIMCQWCAFSWENPKLGGILFTLFSCWLHAFCLLLINFPLERKKRSRNA